MLLPREAGASESESLALMDGKVLLLRGAAASKLESLALMDGKVLPQGTIPTCNKQMGSE